MPGISKDIQGGWATGTFAIWLGQCVTQDVGLLWPSVPIWQGSAMELPYIEAVYLNTSAVFPPCLHGFLAASGLAIG